MSIPTTAIFDKVPVPSHVPEELVVDIDIFRLPGGREDVHRAWANLQNGPEIVWTPRNGGHWIAVRAEDIALIQTDHTRFSHRAILIPKQVPGDLEFAPLLLDPPESRPYRKILTPFFLPKVVNQIEKRARPAAIELIEQLLPAGKCDFMAAFARIFPVEIFMSMLDLPMEDRPVIQPLAEMSARGTPQEREYANRTALEYLRGWIGRRSANPGDDVISNVLKADIDGRPLTSQEIENVCVLILLGGLDTVASMLGFIMHHLATHPTTRAALYGRLDDATFMRHAIEELIRRHGVSNTARMIAYDFDYKGLSFKAGEMIQQPNCLFGLDPRVNPVPMEVDFDRKPPIRHVAFGSGVHSCPGSVLARREISICLEEWLVRLPEFTLDPENEAVFASGMVNGVVELPLVWEG